MSTGKDSRQLQIGVLVFAFLILGQILVSWELGLSWQVASAGSFAFLLHHLNLRGRENLLLVLLVMLPTWRTLVSYPDAFLREEMRNSFVYSGPVYVLSRVSSSTEGKCTYIVRLEVLQEEVVLRLRGIELPWNKSVGCVKGFWLDADVKGQLYSQGWWPWEFNAHLLRQGIAGEGMLRHANSWSPKEGCSSKGHEAFVSDLIAEVGGGPALAVTLASTIGDTSLLNNELKTLFRDTALTHQMVVSGYQVTLLWFLSGSIFRWVFSSWRRFFEWPLPYFVQRAVGINLLSFLCVVLYLLLLDNEVPSTRAWMWLVLLGVGKMLGRNMHSLRSVLLVSYLLLLVFPGALFEMSYQLTVAAFLGLLLGLHWAKSRARVLGILLAHVGPILLTSPILLLWTHTVVPGALLANILFGWAFSVLFICFGGGVLLFYSLGVPYAQILLHLQNSLGEAFLSFLSEFHFRSSRWYLGSQELSPSLAYALATGCFCLIVLLIPSPRQKKPVDSSFFPNDEYE